MDAKKKSVYLKLASRWNSSAIISKEEMFTKFRREGLDPETDTIIHISRCAASYDLKLNRQVRQIGVRRRHVLKLWHDFISMFWLPIYVHKNDIKPDVLIVAEPLLTISGLFLKIFSETKIVFNLTNLPKDLANTRRFSFLRRLYFSVVERIAVATADVIVVINDATYAYISKTGVNPKKIYIQNSDVIERDRQYIETAKPGWVKGQWNIPVDQKIILSVGRLEAEKDYPRLIRYMSALPNDYTLVICGSGALEPKLIELAEEVGISDRVIFVGYVPRSEIWHYYVDADVFVLLSQSEALGLVVWEAMYMRCPVIVSEADGLLESVGLNQERGFVLQSDASPEKFFQCVRQATDSSEDTRQKIDRAYRYVEEKSLNIVKMSDILSTINK